MTVGAPRLYLTFPQAHAFDDIGPQEAVNDVLMGTSDVGIFDNRGAG